MNKIDPKQIDENFIRLIGDDWMLVTAGNPGGYNTMTASWGAAGVLWNKKVVFVFIRPQRYTFEFMEREEVFTLSFFGKEHREALALCGRVSGRETDKATEAGLTAFETPGGGTAFREAGLILECRKLYADFLHKDMFIDGAIIGNTYPCEDFHKMYVGEITGAWSMKDNN